MGIFGARAYDEVEELLEEVKKINKRLDIIEKKVNALENKRSTQEEWLNSFGDYCDTPVGIPNVCKACPNHPINGGSGVCNCTAPYITH